MKPRVFVSSTYYDLKHVRERIERFIENYGYEPVLFESDNVIFEHNKPLDASCYNEVKLCHLMILIVGGRYGSAATDEASLEFKKAYEEYTSITRKEFETARKMKIPVFIFIEKNVHAEYETYRGNKTFLEEKGSEFNFAHVDDINVFKFISTLHSSAIKTFDKTEDIESYLCNQLAGMMYLYLEQLRSKGKENDILDSVSELRNVTNRMNDIVLAVGKKVITGEDYEAILFTQNKHVIDLFIDQFFDNVKFEDECDVSSEQAKEFCTLCENTLFDIKRIQEAKKSEDWFDIYALAEKLAGEFRSQISKINPKLVIEYFDNHKIIDSYTSRIDPIIKSNKQLYKYWKEGLNSRLVQETMKLPF